MSDLQRSNDGLYRYNGKPLPNFPEGKIFPSKGLSRYQIAKYTEKIQKRDIKEISSLISHLCAMVGLPKTSYPAEADKKALILLVKSELKNKTVEEIELAFRVASKGWLNVYLNTFGAFSFEYINRILNAYNKWLSDRREIKELPDAPVEKTPEQIEQENLAALKRNCQNIFEELNKGVDPGSIFIQPSLYNILKDNDLIETKKWPKVEGYKSWQEQCSNEYLKLNPKKDIYEQITAEGARNDGMKMAVIYTIQAMIKEKSNSEILEIIEGLQWVK